MFPALECSNSLSSSLSVSTGKSAKFLHPLLKGEKVSSSGNDSSPSLNFAVSPQKTDSSKSAEGGNSIKSMHSVAGAGNFTCNFHQVLQCHPRVV